MARPDLLLVGALLHDIGKGYPGDHSVTGAALARRIATRMGFSDADAATVAALARHHLLLPDTATRRDLEDPSTVALVVSAIGGSAELLELLHYLTIADAAATGPAAWSDWKASLVNQLVRRVGAVLGGGRLPPAQPPSEAVLRLARRGGTEVLIEGSDVLVAAPDATGLLSSASGLLALHSLDVQAADVRTVGSMAVNRFTVSPRFGAAARSGAAQRRPAPDPGRHARAGRAVARQATVLPPFCGLRALGRPSRRPGCSGSTTRPPTPPCWRSGPGTRSACCTG